MSTYSDNIVPIICMPINTNIYLYFNIFLDSSKTNINIRSKIHSHHLLKHFSLRFAVLSSYQKSMLTWINMVQWSTNHNDIGCGKSSIKHIQNNAQICGYNLILLYPTTAKSKRNLIVLLVYVQYVYLYCALSTEQISINEMIEINLIRNIWCYIFKRINETE